MDFRADSNRIGIEADRAMNKDRTDVDAQSFRREALPTLIPLTS
jgi:hypothetical protein